MRGVTRGISGILGAGLSLLAVSGHAQPVSSHVALVLGEAAYTGFPTLPGCATSAEVIASRLRQLGFDVIARTDASNGAMGAALTELARRIAATSAATVVIYVCSYAVRFDDRIFILPVTASLPRPSDVLTEGVPAQSIVDLARRNTHVSLAVLDMFGRAGEANSSVGNPNDFVARQRLTPGHFILAATELTASATATPLSQGLSAMLVTQPVDVATMLDGIKKATDPNLAIAMAGASNPSEPALLVPPAPAPMTPAITALATPPPAPAAAAPIPAPTMPEEEQYSPSDRRRVQAALKQLGYYSGAVDGLIGPDTRAAIRRYQYELHASMTGRLTPEQATRLVSRLQQAGD